MVRTRGHLAHRDARLCLADEAETRAICPTVPYRFGGEFGAQIGPKRAIPSIRKLLTGANFPSNLGKIGSPKNKLPLLAPQKVPSPYGPCICIATQFVSENKRCCPGERTTAV